MGVLLDRNNEPDKRYCKCSNRCNNVHKHNFLFFALLLKKEEREKHINEEIFGRVTKGMIVVGIVSIIACMFLPAKETMYKMLAASYITQENIESVGESIDKIADKLVEKINQVKK